MTFNSTSPIPSIRSSKKHKEPDIKIEFPQKLIEIHNPIKDMPISNISRRLALRKDLHNRLSSLSDMMCFVGLFGIILMIIETEIVFTQIDQKDTRISWFIKLMITVSTIILICLILLYHRLDLTLYSVNNCINDWRVGLTITKVFQIAVEVIICAIHPLPRSFPKYRPTIVDRPSSTLPIPARHFIYYTSIDVVLGLLMFVRLYLLCRFIVYHSHLVRDTSSQSVGYLNRVSINFLFVIKTYLDRRPARYLLVFCILIFLIGSWSLRACDYEPGIDRLPILDAMWLFIVTFTTVGYGDITPVTYCGRSVATIISVIGIFLSALLITVLSQKLTLTRWEKYVHSFVLNTELAKQHKAQAANIIKHALRIWIWERTNKPLSSIQHLEEQRKLFRSIDIIHHIKQKERKLIDNNIGLPEIVTLQRETNTTTDKTMQKLTHLELKIDSLEDQINNVNYTMDSIQTTLDLLVDKVTK